MIDRGQIVARLREADFTFIQRKKRTEIWRKRGRPLFVMVPHRNLFTPDEAGVILRQAKLSPDAVDRFLKGCIHTSASDN